MVISVEVEAGAVVVEAEVVQQVKAKMEIKFASHTTGSGLVQVARMSSTTTGNVATSTTAVAALTRLELRNCIRPATAAQMGETLSELLVGSNPQ